MEKGGRRKDEDVPSQRKAKEKESLQVPDGFHQRVYDRSRRIYLQKGTFAF